MSLTKKLAESGDFVSLPQEDDYLLYFEQIKRVCNALDAWCEQQASGGGEESKVLRLFLSRFLNTIELLRERQRFRPDKNLKIDLNESGFPHLLGLQELNADLLGSSDRLKQLPSMANLKEDALNELFETQGEPLGTLGLMAERNYLERLRDADFMSPFRFAGVQLRGKEGKRRHYMCAWSCYNAADNLPYVHTMLFEQDTRETALEKKGENYEELKSIISNEGRRVPPLAVLAMAIDNQLEGIHPKILKRTKIGPLALPRFTFDQGPIALMVKGLAKPTEFSVEITTETIFSTTEVVKEKGSWLRPDKVRSVFAIPENDLECFMAKTSRIHKYLLLPHHLMQHLRSSDPEAVKLYENHELFAYDDQLSVYQI